MYAELERRIEELEVQMFSMFKFRILVEQIVTNFQKGESYTALLDRLITALKEERTK